MNLCLRFLLLSAVTVLSSQSYANSIRLACKNVSSSAIAFSLEINGDKAQIIFDKTIPRNETEQDIVGRTVNLKFMPELSDMGYLFYDAAIIVDKYSGARDITLHVSKLELQKSANIRVIMSPSSVYPGYGGGGSPFSSDTYGMICQKK